MAIIPRGHEFYVRLTAADQQLADVGAIVGESTSVLAEAGSPFCVVMWAAEDFVPPEQLFARLSRDLVTDVLWLAWQKQVDAFAFQRWANGEPVRRLEYGVREKERTWEIVDGRPEPWEGDALFPAARLGRQLRVRSLFPDPDEVPEVELKRIWQERLLEVDSQHPRLVAIDAARVVARHYGLPGWSP